jgi:hypothetical protein
MATAASPIFILSAEDMTEEEARERFGWLLFNRNKGRIIKSKREVTGQFFQFVHEYEVHVDDTSAGSSVP